MGHDAEGRETEVAESRWIGFLLLPGFPLMAYAAAVEPLRAANALAGRDLYRWWHVSPDGAPVHASSGLAIVPDGAVGKTKLEAERIFVCAGGNPSLFSDAAVFAWLRRIASQGAAVGGISGGPFILARAGLLDEHRCTVHWEHIPAFQETFPNTCVERSLFEIDRGRITCSGGIAALDMSLHLIGLDHGAALAREVSDWFLHNQIREGPSPQRMTFAKRFNLRDPRLTRILEAIDSHIETPLSRPQLAEMAHLSERHLERLFRASIGTSLHQYYLRQRLAQAARLKRETEMGLEEIAQATGFRSASELRRAERRGKSDS